MFCQTRTRSSKRSNLCLPIGVPHETWAEAVKALMVVRQSGCLSEEELIARCKTELGGAKAPKSVEFRVEIPKTPLGESIARTSGLRIGKEPSERCIEMR